jgi:hypothetical protein
MKYKGQMLLWILVFVPPLEKNVPLNYGLPMVKTGLLLSLCCVVVRVN